MPTEQTQFTGLAIAGAHHKLAGYFGISVEVQRRIGTFIVLFSMIEQQLEFVLLQSSEPKPDGQWATDRMTVGERLKVLRALAASEPGLAHELTIAADLGALLMEARHTVAHGAPLETARLEKNRSWFGEPRKRPFAALQLTENVLDAAASVGDILFRLLSSICARLAGQQDIAAITAPSDEEMQGVHIAAGTIRAAMADIAEASECEGCREGVR